MYLAQIHVHNKDFSLKLYMYGFWVHKKTLSNGNS